MRTKFQILMRIKLLLFLAALLCLAAQTPAKAMTEVADTVIVIEPLPGYQPGHGPKAPFIVPIHAHYVSLLSTVILTFTANLGEIEVEITNTTTGGYDSGIIDTQYLSDSIPITMGSGHYIILFTLPSGRRYIGEFDV